MKLKQKFTVSNLIMLITSIALVGVISVCFLIAFIMKYPVEDMHITRAALLNPLVLNKAIGDFFQKNPETILYVLAWALLCICVFAVTVTLFTRRLAMSIQKTIDELTSAADNIRNGDLSFQVMGSSCDEIDVLCQSFDSMRRTLKSAADKEKYMKEERSMLLANLSHDLKTPVTSIKGYIEGIRDGIADTPEKQKRYLDTIYSKAGMIDDMVNNLSIFSKLEMSKLNFEFTTGDINLFLRDFAEDFRLDIEKNDMRLALDIENTPATVKIDYEKMGRVFANLINNAVKYKKPGRGELKISSHIEDGGGLSVAQAISKYARACYDGPFIQHKDYILQSYSYPEQKAALSLWKNNNMANHLVPAMSISADESAELAKINTEIKTYSQETIFKMIIQPDGMSLYDDFINNLKQMGIERAIEIKQKAYDRVKTEN